MTKMIKCDEGAFKFMIDLANAGGDDLVYSLALERGNMFMCVTAFPSMTKKRFDTSEDGMRAVFLLDTEEYGESQSDMVNSLVKLINNHIYYVNEDMPIEFDPITTSDGGEKVKDNVTHLPTPTQNIEE